MPPVPVGERPVRAVLQPVRRPAGRVALRRLPASQRPRRRVLRPVRTPARLRHGGDFSENPRKTHWTRRVPGVTMGVFPGNPSRAFEPTQARPSGRPRHVPIHPPARRRPLGDPRLARVAPRPGHPAGNRQAPLRRPDREGFPAPQRLDRRARRAIRSSLTDLPLNIVPLADGRHAWSPPAGTTHHDLSLVDLDEKKVVDVETVRQSWFGLAVEPDGRARLVVGRRRRPAPRVPSSRGSDADPHERPSPSPNPARRKKAKADRRRKRPGPETRSRPLPERPGARRPTARRSTRSTSTPARSPRQPLGEGDDRRRAKVAPAGVRPYDVVVARNGSRLYVSDWAEPDRPGRSTRPSSGSSPRSPVGEHPNQIAVHPKDDRLFVACASSNSVAVIDTRRGVVTETIVTALFPHGPEGSTPDALAVAPDGETLYVANADNNCVAVDRRRAAPTGARSRASSPPAGIRRPSPSRPTARRCWSASARGTRPGRTRSTTTRAEDREAPSRARSPKTGSLDLPFPYIGTTLSGALSIVPVPDDKPARRLHRDGLPELPLLRQAPRPTPPIRTKTAIPTKVGDPSPIKHVIYIIKENRTYDQVFGDIAAGQRRPVAGDVRPRRSRRTTTSSPRSSCCSTTCTATATSRPTATPGPRWPTTPTTSPGTGP